MPPLAFSSALRASGRKDRRLPGARRERGFALFGVDVGDVRRAAVHGPRERKSHQPDSAEADQEQRRARGAVGEALERGIGGQPRAHQRAGVRRR